ncbi:hypothetical protein RF11_03687 [Thelohanellus kitauei]|uniref:Uncharacterized protein n=1 Tax=Thelohanellus kitauei TaxID=669202 RepID=A0A0C2MPR9_THEKT|nr:hypothetical protein RF11_03687 [Thelohanellus kitauei]
MIDVIRCSESNRRESICERIVPFPVFRACLADLWEPLRNVQDIIIRREYFEAVGRRTIQMPQRYNSIALCCDHIVAFYDGKVASMKPRDIYREHWQEVLQSLPRSHSWTETQYLAAHCFNWHISQWMYEISAFSDRLHSSVDSLLKERNRHPNSVECGRLKVEARFDKHQLTYWLIEITEASLRNSYPNIDGLIQKVVETTLPKVSQIAPVIKEYVDTTLPHIRRLYQLDKYLTVEGMIFLPYNHVIINDCRLSLSDS